MAADLGEDLMVAVVGRHEADDRAVARPAVQVIVAVEDHVLGPLDRAQPDRLDVPQAVVGRESGGLAACRRGDVEVGRGYVDLAEDLAAVLNPFRVDEDREDQHEAQDEQVHGTRDAEAHEPVGHHQHQERADDGVEHRSPAAAQRGPAEHDRGEDRDLHADPGIGARAAEARREQERRDARQQPRPDIAEADSLPHVDAGVVRRPAGAPDGAQPPARPHPGEHQVPS